MRPLIMAVLVFAFGVNADSQKEISGTITAASSGAKMNEPSGVLYVFARKSGGMGGPPAAVLRIPNPKFPLNFKLSEANAMMPGTKFDGPFTITARYSPTGDAMDKSGPQGESSAKDIKPGAKDVKIELKK